VSEILEPREPRDVQHIVEWALGEGKRLRIEGRGSKRALHAASEPAQLVSLRRLAGVIEYQPEELVLTARAGTRIADIEALLAQRNQMLAFEPPDLGAILGGADNDGSLGGTIACNLAGPRRISAGAARDHFLGFQATNGRGERFKSGGKVVKNVTGYDLSKLLAGSRGTLAILDEVTIKVMPAPEATGTLLVPCAADAEAIALLCRAMGSAHDVSGAAYLPASVAARSLVDELRRPGSGMTALRVEGVTPSVQARLAALEQAFGGGRSKMLDTLESRRLWRELRDARPLWAGTPSAARELWRLSVPPAAGAEVVARLRAGTAAIEPIYDWSGGLIWLSMATDAGNGEAIRAAVSACGGHCTPIRASSERHTDTTGPIAKLSQRIRESFDPRGIFA